MDGVRTKHQRKVGQLILVGERLDACHLSFRGAAFAAQHILQQISEKAPQALTDASITDDFLEGLDEAIINGCKYHDEAQEALTPYPVLSVMIFNHG